MSSKAIAERKKACGYTPATLRTDNCAGCAHMTYEYREETPVWRRVLTCHANNIFTTVGSKCDRWQPKP